MSAWIIHTIVTKMRYVPIFLAHSNVFVVLATKEMANIVRTMMSVLKMSITVQKTPFALIHRVVSLAHATMATMKRTKSVSRMSTNVI